MNFFQAQDNARRKTGILVALFFAAIVLLVAGVYLAFHVVFWGSEARTGEPFLNIDRLINVSAGILAVVAFGSLYKIMALSSGGDVVAQSLGGRLLLSGQESDRRLQRLLNIVDEMAIASGVPVPQVYLVPGEGINAFAAGTTINNAVIGVTEQAVALLSRDEMQGVIAHEFSHILNGDMRLNIRLTGIIHGLLLLGILGYFCLRAGLYSSLSRFRSPAQVAIPIMGLVLIVVGFLGTVCGRLIQAAVSRQREFLADASAVQFTRNPHGIGGALEKIGVHAGVLSAPAAREYAHFFFASALSGGLSSLLATHPPLPERIKRLLPDWEGHIATEQQAGSAPTPQSSPLLCASHQPLLSQGQALIRGAVESDSLIRGAVASEQQAGSASLHTSQAVSGLSAPCPLAAAEVVDKVGTIGTAASPPLSACLTQALEDPYSVRALLYAMLIDRHHDESRRQQLLHLEQHADTGVYASVIRLLPEVQALSHRDCLPLLQRSIPPLRLLSVRQYHLFIDNLATLVAVDAQIDLFEWCVQAVVTHVLHEHFGGDKISGQAGVEEMSYALSLLAMAGHAQDAAQVVNQAGATIQAHYVADSFHPQRLFSCMQKISRLHMDKKQRFVQAAVACVLFDGMLNADEEALLRAYLMILDCPLPAFA